MKSLLLIFVPLLGSALAVAWPRERTRPLLLPIFGGGHTLLAFWMLFGSFSFSNLGLWTPMTTSSFGYFFSNLTRSGISWMQLIQQRVQKSKTTTLPRRSRR